MKKSNPYCLKQNLLSGNLPVKRCRKLVAIGNPLKYNMKENTENYDANPRIVIYM